MGHCCKTKCQNTASCQGRRLNDLERGRRTNQARRGSACRTRRRSIRRTRTSTRPWVTRLPRLLAVDVSPHGSRLLHCIHARQSFVPCTTPRRMALFFCANANRALLPAFVLLAALLVNNGSKKQINKFVSSGKGKQVTPTKNTSAGILLAASTTPTGCVLSG